MNKEAVVRLGIGVIFLAAGVLIFTKAFPKDKDQSTGSDTPSAATSNSDVNNDKTENNTDNSESDESDNVEIKTDDYTIILQGAARPDEGDITIENAAQIALDYLTDELKIDFETTTVNMIFLDKTSFTPGIWSATIPINDTERYNITINAETKNILTCNTMDN